MFKTFNVQLNERVVVFRDSIPFRALEPGRHRLWGRRLTEQRFHTDKLEFDALPEVRAIMPDAWFDEVVLTSRQRGVLFQNAVPMVFLRPGTHRFFTVDPSVRLEVLDVEEPMPELTDELKRVVPKIEFVEQEVLAYERGLKFVQGRLEQVLEPGRYTFWSHPAARVNVTCVDMRAQQITIAGQDLMTRDKVTLRLTLSVSYAVEDPAKMAQTVAQVHDPLYLAVQLVARDYVSGVTLDALLEGRDEMTHFLADRVKPRAAAWGVRVDEVGVKDVVLPGDMKMLLNRVIEAEKEAAANVIRRREETATTRSLANTARVMADHPVLLRLKELDAFTEMAERVQHVRLVVGADGLGQLLSPKSE